MGKFSRYSRDSVFSGAKFYGTATAVLRVRGAVADGSVRTAQYVMRSGERLDILAGRFYDDATLWWILAAASDIGWGLQVPPGTIITVPELTDIAQVL